MVQTAVVLDVINPTPATTGRQFRAVASNSAGVVNSSAAVLNVNPAAAGAKIVFTRGFGIQASSCRVMYQANGDRYSINGDGTGRVAFAATLDIVPRYVPTG